MLILWRKLKLYYHGSLVMCTNHILLSQCMTKEHWKMWAKSIKHSKSNRPGTLHPALDIVNQNGNNMCRERISSSLRINWFEIPYSKLKLLTFSLEKAEGVHWTRGLEFLNTGRCIMKQKNCKLQIDIVTCTWSSWICTLISETNSGDTCCQSKAPPRIVCNTSPLLSKMRSKPTHTHKDHANQLLN